jgi:archaellum component FlaC
MVVMTRETWTDGRMDEFKESVNLRFDEVNRRFDEVDKRFEQVDKRLGRIEGDIREIRQTVERMNTRMTTGFIALAGLIVSGQVFF